MPLQTIVLIYSVLSVLMIFVSYWIAIFVGKRIASWAGILLGPLSYGAGQFFLTWALFAVFKDRATEVVIYYGLLLQERFPILSHILVERLSGLVSGGS